MTTGEGQWRWTTLDQATAAQLLADRLPGASGRLLPLGFGDYCFAFKLGRTVVRIARHLEAAAALQRESCVLAVIADALPLPVPRPAYHSPDTCPPYTLHDELTGEVLTRDSWLAMPRPARARAACDLARFLAALHGIAVADVVNCGLPHLDAAEVSRRVRRGAMESLFSLLDGENRRRLDAALAEWSSPPPGGEPAPVLLHCDIAPGHVLCDPDTGNLTGVIDFGDVAVGDPVRDFIFIYEDFGPELLGDVLSRYARESVPVLLSDVRKWYLLEAAAWTYAMRAAGRDDEVAHGLGEITRELEMLATRQQML